MKAERSLPVTPKQNQQDPVMVTGLPAQIATGPVLRVVEKKKVA